MIALLVSLFLSAPAMAIEVPSSSLQSYVGTVDQGPQSYKNFSCAWYPWHQAHLCSWKNRVTKQGYNISGVTAANLLKLLENNGAAVKCNTSPWGEVCEAYYYSVVCNEVSCKMKPL